MDKEKCILCGKESVSVIKTDTGFMCYNCYANQRNPSRSKEVHNNEEARIQTEFFKLLPLYFPNIPDKLIFAVPNGGSKARSFRCNRTHTEKRICFALFRVQD